MTQFRPREGQRQILEYQGGQMGVSAVPGSGKTATIAALAARLIAERFTGEGQVLVVTYQTAAVDNVRARIRQELEGMGLVQAGYDVRTLHSLSYSIVRANPGLAGAAAEFDVLDERASNNLLDKAVRIWNNQNTRVWANLAPGDYYDEKWEREWRRIAQKVAWTVISTAKNRRLRPEGLLTQIEAGGGDDLNVFLRIGAEIYRLYQLQVETIGGVDFNDLVWMAVDLLEHHPDLRARLGMRWPVVLEDEAQDSVPLQEELLQLLSGGGGNWIRVGDPNQAIMSTFTAADPRYLRRFLDREDVQTLEMAISGRCAEKILDLANYLVEWAGYEHSLKEVRERAFRQQQIRPTGADDPQQNPPDSDIAFRQYNHRQEELRDVVNRAGRFAAANPDRTLSILVPTNRLGYEVAELLRESGADFDEVLQSGRSARQVSETVCRLLSFLAEPLQRNFLEEAYLALRENWPGPEGAGDEERVGLLLRSCYRLEDLLFPGPDVELEDALPPVGEIAPTDLEAIELLARYLRRWLRATALPVDQLLMAVAQDILKDADLARAQKLAVYLRNRGDQNLDWRLPELARELAQATRGKGVLAEEEEIFEPKPGKITLTTMHKAKGLEWDLVYMVGVDGDWFPCDLDDHFRGEYEFLGGDPGEEARAGLLELIGEAGEERLSATDLAHVEVIAERLRLLYVGITRARRYLAVSWSREVATATRSRAAPPAAVFLKLQQYYRTKNGNG
jgi:DNA helicase II / ATP-dependent DNA helicase PcrA